MRKNENYRPRGYRVMPRSGADIEQIAATARHRFAPNVPATEPISGREFFEGLDKIQPGTKPLTFGVIDELPPGQEGLTYHDRKRDRIVVALPEKTYEGLVREHTSPRFTVFHEFGHCILHEAQVLRLASIPHSVAALMRGSPSHRPFEDTEWQADRFAGAFMAPASGLKLLEKKHGVLTADTISQQYNMSFRAAEIRLANYRNLHPRMNR